MKSTSKSNVKKGTSKAKQTSNQNQALKLSKISLVASIIVACISSPFILIAGIGLLVVIPFGFFAKNETAVYKAIQQGSTLSTRTRRLRALLIGLCCLGFFAIVGLFQLANSGNTELSTQQRVVSVIPWAAAMLLFMGIASSVQVMYKKR